MGRITLGQFKEVTQQADDDAKIRLGSTDRQPKTASHGFLGRAVRWLFGATKQDRADNQKIMGDLVAGLKQKYGSKIGVKAFLRAVPDARIRDDGVLEAKTTKPLTARQVHRAQHDAELMLARKRNANREALVSYEAPVPGASRKHFTELEAQFPELQQHDLTSAERLAYNTRLEERVALESQLHRKELSHDQMAQIAADTLQQVLKLSKAGGLVEASRARAAYDLALTNLVRALARHENETTLAKLLQTANERLKDRVAAEMIEQDPGGGERGDLTELALHRCHDITKDDLAQAQKNALQAGAPLRAISGAAKDLVQTGSFTGETEATDRTPERQEVAGRYCRSPAPSSAPSVSASTLSRPLQAWTPIAWSTGTSPTVPCSGPSRRSRTRWARRSSTLGPPAGIWSKRGVRARERRTGAP
jgi:hypothetical protein